MCDSILRRQCTGSITHASLDNPAVKCLPPAHATSAVCSWHRTARSSVHAIGHKCLYLAKLLVAVQILANVRATQGWRERSAMRPAGWSLLEHVALMIGNSSSGIMESPSLKLPCIDVGDRQKGRTRAANIIHTDADAVAIVQGLERACSAEFRASLAGLVNPYGDGHASDRIIDGLIRAPSKERLLRKRALKLNRSGGFDNPAAPI